MFFGMRMGVASSCKIDRSVMLPALGLLISCWIHFFVLSQFLSWSDLAFPMVGAKITARIPAIVAASHSSSEELVPMPVVVPDAALAPQAPVGRRDNSVVSGVSINHDESPEGATPNNISLSEVRDVRAVSQASASAPEIAPPSSDAAPPLPTAVMIEFASGGLLDGSVQFVHRFRQADAHYVLSVEGGKTFGWSDPVQTTSLSEGSFVNGELMPARYLGPSGETVRFDWDTQQAVFGTSRVVALQGEAKDPLSIMYQLMRLVRSGVTSVVVLDGCDELQYDLMLLGEEGLDIGDTHYSTWRVRLSLQSDPRSYREFWLGREVSGMPLKIREALSDGKVRELLAKRIEVEMP